MQWEHYEYVNKLEKISISTESESSLVESNHTRPRPAETRLGFFFDFFGVVSLPISRKRQNNLIGMKVKLSSLRLMLRARPGHLGAGVIILCIAAPLVVDIRHLPRPVVEVRVPRGPGAVEGKRQLLVVLVFLTPHPKGGKHLERKSA